MARPSSLSHGARQHRAPRSASLVLIKSDNTPPAARLPKENESMNGAMVLHRFSFSSLVSDGLIPLKPDTRWIARVLGITPDEVNLALSRLARLGLLEMVDRDHWVDKSGDATTSLAEFSAATIRHLSEQMRRVMLEVMGAVPASSYEHSSTTLALHGAPAGRSGTDRPLSPGSDQSSRTRPDARRRLPTRNQFLSGHHP